MTSLIAHSIVPASFVTMPKSDRIRTIVEMVDDDEYKAVTEKLASQFDLDFRFGAQHQFGIKTVIKRRDFHFTDGISASSRIFMIVHTLGHYYFISRAAQMGIDRYKYIYDTFENTNLHVYQQAEAKPDPEARKVTDKIRRDRTEFEVRANDYALDLLKAIGHPNLMPLVKIYEPADVNYILDVTEGGKDAIVPTDFDYLDRYVCTDQIINEEQNSEFIYKSGTFEINAIDWELLEKSKIEIHFF